MAEKAGGKVGAVVIFVSYLLGRNTVKVISFWTHFIITLNYKEGDLTVG